MPATVAVIAAVLLVVAVVLAVLRSLVTYANLVLSRREDVLHLRHGLLRLREHTYDMSRLRGGTLRQPLLVRVFGGAGLDAVMTGVHGAGESSVLLPPCPRSTAESVLTGLVGDPNVVTGPLRGHGRRAAARRWTRGALGLPVLIGAVLAVVALTGIAVVPLWLWTAWVAVTAWCALLAADRIGALGHRVDSHWLVMRAGSWERRRDCLATAGIIGWTVRQSPFQRRAGVATLVAATAAGTKRYPLIDVPEDQAWAVAAQASPWVAESIWAIEFGRTEGRLAGVGDVALSGQSTYRFDPCPELVGAGRGHRRSAADAAQLIVNPPVRLARSMVCHRHQSVEFAAQVSQLAVPGDRFGHGSAAAAATVKLLNLAAQQQLSHLIGVQQAG